MKYKGKKISRKRHFDLMKAKQNKPVYNFTDFKLATYSAVQAELQSLLEPFLGKENSEDVRERMNAAMTEKMIGGFRD